MKVTYQPEGSYQSVLLLAQLNERNCCFDAAAKFYKRAAELADNWPLRQQASQRAATCEENSRK